MSEGQSNETNQPQGVLGDGALKAGRYNMALVRRAIRDDWPISAEDRKMIQDQMVGIVKSSKSNRSKIAAAKVVQAGDSLNIKREQMDQKGDWWQMKAEVPPDETNVNVNVAVLNNADDMRTGLAALASIRQRLGIGQSAGEHGEGNGSVDPNANGKAAHNPPNGSNGSAAPPNGSSG